MPKVNVRFIYHTQQEEQVKQVGSTHKGPINLTNLYDAYANPSYHDIGINVKPGQSEIKNLQNEVPLQKQIPNVPTVEVESRPNSPKAAKNKIKTSQSVPVEQPNLTQQTTKKARRTQSIKPVLNIQQIAESQLFKKEESKHPVQKPALSQLQQGQIVLKSPSYKFIPKKEGDLNQGTKKQYVRAEKAQKYLYNGIPERSEDDFVGCFGCFQQKPKTYKASSK